MAQGEKGARGEKAVLGEKRTGARILDAALDMFAQRGYDGTNLRDLAASLSLSKSALYRHFSSKEAIWDGLV